MAVRPFDEACLFWSLLYFKLVFFCLGRYDASENEYQIPDVNIEHRASGGANVYTEPQVCTTNTTYSKRWFFKNYRF